MIRHHRTGRQSAEGGFVCSSRRIHWPWTGYASGGWISPSPPPRIHRIHGMQGRKKAPPALGADGAFSSAASQRDAAVATRVLRRGSPRCSAQAPMRRSLARVRLRAVVVMDKRSPPFFRFNIGQDTDEARRLRVREPSPIEEPVRPGTAESGAAGPSINHLRISRNPHRPLKQACRASRCGQARWPAAPAPPGTDATRQISLKTSLSPARGRAWAAAVRTATPCPPPSAPPACRLPMQSDPRHPRPRLSRCPSRESSTSPST